MTRFKTPVLFIVFNDIESTKRVFEVIRAKRPEHFFVFSDGPREDKVGEGEICREVREYVVRSVDWECDFHKKFNDKNIGLPDAVIDGISWFFEQNERGIVLEHDCLPDPSFFQFAEEILEKYKNDERIMHVGGNFLQPSPVGGASYYFSRIPLIWGWATWRRAWLKYDSEMKTYPNFLKEQKLSRVYRSDWYKTEWEYLFNMVYYKISKTWDAQWAYALIENNGFSITPNKNLVTNIGFREGAVHSRNLNDPLSKLPIESMSFPMIHPSRMEVDVRVDEYVSQHFFYFTWYKYVFMKLGLFRIAHKIYRIFR